jgi:hypothetical protein
MEGDNSDSSDMEMEIKHMESDDERKVLPNEEGRDNSDRAIRRTFRVTNYDTSDTDDDSNGESTAVNTLRISRSARGIRSGNVDRDTSNISGTSDRTVEFRRRPLTRRRVVTSNTVPVQAQPPTLDRIITPLTQPTISSSSEQVAVPLAQPAALAQFANVIVSTDSTNLLSRFNVPPAPHISNEDIIQQQHTTRSATGFGTYTRFINAFDDLFPSDRYSFSSEEKNIIPCPIPNGSDVEAKPSLFVCQICQLNQISTITFPCMHCCMCDTCAYEFSKIGNTCPMCRLGIVQIGKIYLSSKQADELEPHPGKLKLNPSNSSSSTDV